MRKEFFIWLLGLALVITVAYGYAHQRNIHARYIEFKQNELLLEDIRHEIEALRTRVEQTRTRVENMENDPVEIEAAIRRIRRLTRPGETIFRIEDAPAPVTPPISGTAVGDADTTTP